MSKVQTLSKAERQTKKGVVVADNESVRRSMKYEDKILELIAELMWLKAEDSSGSQSKKKVLEKVEGLV
jgi:hypothetical protein